MTSSSAILALRNYWAADAIIYFTTGNGNLWGIANEPLVNGLPAPGPSFANYAIAVTLAAHAINPGDWIAAHEFAHTLGANHNPDHIPVNPDPVEPWAFGHWARERNEDVPVGARTLMSYEEECLAVVNPCPRILYYSNPNVIVDGWFQTGLANQRDNARLINDIAPIEAQYRASIGRIFADGFD